MASDARFVAFETRAAMAASLADVIVAQVSSSLAAERSARLAVSGGSTPADLYRALSARDIDWRNVAAALVDERWTPPGTEGSNETFLHETLGQGRASKANIVGLWSDAPSPAAGLGAAEARIEALAAPFDAVVLGMGPDGHTASWFPYAEGLGSAIGDGDAKVAAVTAKASPVTGDHTARLTLTLAALATARFICLLITGEEKRAAFAAARGDGPVEAMPVRAILRARPDLWACWAP